MNDKATRVTVFDRGLGKIRPIGQAPLSSSTELGWSGFYLEHQKVPNFEGEDVVWMNNVVFVLLNQAINVEYRDGGGYVSKRIEPGQISLRPAQVATSCRCRQAAEYLSISIEPSFMNLACGESAGLNRFELSLMHGVEDQFIKEVCLNLQQEVESGGHSGVLYSEALATSLAVHLTKKYNASQGNQTGEIYHPSKRMVRQAMEYIESRLGANVSLFEIAKAVDLSPFHFSRMFKQYVGVSPYQFVIKQRVERAKRLLLKGSLPITAIATEVGFSDQSHLTRQFKRFCGTTPRAFAKQYTSRRTQPSTD